MMHFPPLRFAFPALFSLLVYAANAQQCQYKIVMHDAYGDGWNGGLLTVLSGSTTNLFTLDDDLATATVSFDVTSGAPVVLTWTPGDFDDEISFELYNNDGDLLYKVSYPKAGALYTGTGACVACLKPGNVIVDNVYDTRVKLRWTPATGSSAPAGWRVIYDTAGFAPGPGAGDTLNTALPKVTVTGLQKKTKYDFYVQQDCGNGETGTLAGPFTVETYWTNDVGITGVLNPQNSCDLGVERVTIVMKNSGANPQTLIPFNYSVNGKPSGVPQPQDGFYTGVLGKDSSKVIKFETQFDFSSPGEYLIAVWTTLPGDEDTANDTFYYRIVNRLAAPYEQDFETWSGGWYVDSASVFPSWQLGQPAAALISAAASGKNAWVTNLTGLHNSDEHSYLRSPCFDFSDLAEDPVVEFSLFYVTETNFDGGWLEMSLDNGDTWKKVGALGQNLNWYNVDNTIQNLGHVWAGNSGRWVLARHALNGAAGKAGVRLRFAFAADDFMHFEGLGIDAIRIYEPLTDDLAGLSVSTEADGQDCGLKEDVVSFRLSNFGSEPQTLFQVGYSINGTAPLIENVGNIVVQPGAVLDYDFTVPFDSRDGIFTIKCWTKLTGELYPQNDTATYTINHLPDPVPFHEDFESGALPQGWSSSGSVEGGHNNTSQVLAYNMYDFKPDYLTTLPRLGFISPGDSLTFDYRITDYDSEGTVPTTLVNDTKFEVQVSSDCGDNWTTLYTIDKTTHKPNVNLQTVGVGLSAFAGYAVSIQIKGSWDGGDFYFDLDNVNLRACPGDMMLSATTTPAAPGQSNGTATVKVGVGNPPYTYTWSSGATTQTATGLPAGPVTVTVVDAFGCSSTLAVTIGTSATGEMEGLTQFALLPNPTAGITLLQLQFDHSVAQLDVHILDLLGRSVWESHTAAADRFAAPLDLSGYPDGLYLVYIAADGRQAVQKLVKSSRQ